MNKPITVDEILQLFIENYEDADPLVADDIVKAQLKELFKSCVPEELVLDKVQLIPPEDQKGYQLYFNGANNMRGQTLSNIDSLFGG